MADQIIFTSAVRGIKPGASGYCTVLRSPGIRSALEHELEKISVFEHNKCNQGRLTYAYRQTQIRDKTYCTLSRISDAGKDYTGRTNFLAHHLVFEKGELPELSPADILLNWSGWCQNWSGVPREEAVDLQGFQQIPAIKPPVQLWKEQAVGVDGALKLASDTQSPFTIRSRGCTDVMLLQLIGEAFAVRAKYNKSYRYTWTTTFSVGLNSVGSAKNFKWLALRASDDYALSSSGSVIDLDTSQPGAVKADGEWTAIAREGRYTPAPKPIPLDSGQSVVDMMASRGGAPGKVPPRRGANRSGKVESGPIKPGYGKQLKSAKSPPVKVRKRTELYAAFCLFALLFCVGGVWFGMKLKTEREQIAQEQVSSNYRATLDELVGLHENRKAGKKIKPSRVESVFERLQNIGEAKATSGIGTPIINRDLVSLNQVETENAEKAVEELWGFLQSRNNYETLVENLVEFYKIRESYNEKDVEAVFESMRQASNPKLDSDQDLAGIDWGLISTSYDLVDKNNADNAFNKLRVDMQESSKSIGEAVAAPKEDTTKEPELAEPAPKQGDQPSPFDLGQYEKVFLRQPGETLGFRNQTKFYLIDFKVSKLEVMHPANILNALENQQKYPSYSELAASCSLGDEPDIAIPNSGGSYVIHLPEPDKDSKGPDLFFVLRESFKDTITLGELTLEPSSASAEDAFQQIERKFDAGKTEMWLISGDYKIDGPLPEPSNISNSSGNKSEPVVDPILKHLLEYIKKDIQDDSGAEVNLEKLIEDFDKWAAGKIIDELKKKKNELQRGSSQNKYHKIRQNALFKALNKFYGEIIDNIEETYKAKDRNRVETYFIALNKRIEQLKDSDHRAKVINKSPKDFGLDKPPKKESDSDKKDRIRALRFGMEDAYDKLKENSEKVEFSPNDQTTYTLNWTSIEGSETWSLSYIYKGGEDRERFDPGGTYSKSIISRELDKYIQMEQRAAERAQRAAENEKKIKEFEEVRKWERIEFKDPQSGQVIASVELK